MRQIVLLFLFGTNALCAQYPISGTFSPAEDYKWLIAYKLRPGSQVYVGDTAIKEGKFSLDIPEDEKTGIYRLVYAVPQEEFYFDVIYNGKEPIALSFDTDTGLAFTTSEENKLFDTYFREIGKAEQEIINFYTSRLTDEKVFAELVENLRSVQIEYTTKSKGLICHDFVVANHPYIPSGFESIQVYIRNREQHYFKGLDFKNPILQASGFLIDKVVNYVLTALSLESLSLSETEKEMQNNLRTVHSYMQDVDSSFSTRMYHNLWVETAIRGFNATSDFVYNTYLKALAMETNSTEIIDKIEVHNRLRLGAIAPEITWKDGDTLQKLSSLNATENYILVFWGSGCDHCLNELPKLQERLKGNTGFKVVAVGLEDDDSNWQREAARLPDFEHAISLGKWQSEYADLYAITQTPTYFILDRDKKIIVKPEDYEEVTSFLEGKN